MWIYLTLAFIVALIFAFGLCRAAARPGPSRPERSKLPSSALPPGVSSVKSSCGSGGKHGMPPMQRAYVRGTVYRRWQCSDGSCLPFVRDEG